MKQQANRTVPRRIDALVFCLGLLWWRPPLAGAVLHEVDPATGLASWKTPEQAFSLELIQILPDYVRAVYASRGLPRSVIDKVSSYCVFGTIVRNESDAPLAYRVADWRYRTPDGVEHRLFYYSEVQGGPQAMPDGKRTFCILSKKGDKDDYDAFVFPEEDIPSDRVKWFPFRKKRIGLRLDKGVLLIQGPE